MLSDLAVEAIQNSNKVEAIDVEEGQYVTHPVYEPPPEPRADCLIVSTLTALIDYIQGTDDYAEGAVVHVESPTSVVLTSPIYGRARQREKYCRAQFDFAQFQFGSYYDNEMFLIQLQCRFVRTPEIEKVIKVVGNIEDATVRTIRDDGVTQTVTGKTGIARVADVDIPNPILLAPYRTFPEIPQPESLFVLRLKQTDKMPQCALFEADGGLWKTEAIKGIGAYLAERLPAEMVIIA